MNPLQYTSEEMFSSTELIRKSKLVFDKLHKKEIEKAIILRDGKPSFMLLDFSIYEKIMSEYLSLKELLDNQDLKLNKTKIKDTEDLEILENENSINKDIEEKNSEELNEKDLEEALAQIESLDLDDISNQGTINANTNKEEKEPLKEFWE